MSRLWKNGRMGLEKMGKLSEIVPFFSDFPPMSYQSHIFLYISQHLLLAISQKSPFSSIPPHLHPVFPISPHFPSFPHIFPHFSIFPSRCGWVAN